VRLNEKRIGARSIESGLLIPASVYHTRQQSFAWDRLQTLEREGQMITVMLDNDVAGHRDLFAGTLVSTGWAEYDLIRFITIQEAGHINAAIRLKPRIVKAKEELYSRSLLACSRRSP